MTIKSTVSDTPCKKRELSFPKLMHSKRSTAILLFYSERNGVIVSGITRSKHTVGFSWGAWPMEDFEDYKGSICLENDQQ